MHVAAINARTPAPKQLTGKPQHSKHMRVTSNIYSAPIIHTRAPNEARLPMERLALGAQLAESRTGGATAPHAYVQKAGGARVW